MDGFAFDRLTRSIAADISRRRLLALLTGTSLITALETRLTPLSMARPKSRRHTHHAHAQHAHHKAAEKARRDVKSERQKHRKKKRRRCLPEPMAQTCAGRCGSVANTCGAAVDCGA